MQIIKGVVRATSSSEPFVGAYVRLLGPSGDFVGERRTSESGSFRFHVSPGSWTLRWFTPGGRGGEATIDVVNGQVIDLDILLDEYSVRVAAGER